MYTLRLTGQNVAPRTVRLRELFDFFAHFEDIMLAIAHVADTQVGKQEAVLIPEGYDKKGVGLRVQVPQRFEPLVEKLRALFAEPANSPSREVAHCTRALQRLLHERHKFLEFESTDQSPNSPLVFGPENPLSGQSSETVEEKATVYGVCTRVNLGRKDATLETRTGEKVQLSGLDPDRLKLLMETTGSDFEQRFRVEGIAEYPADETRSRKFKRVYGLDKVDNDSKKLVDELEHLAAEELFGIDPLQFT